MERAEWRNELLESVQQSHLSPHRAGKEGEGDLADDAEEHPDGCCRSAEVAAGVVDVKEEPVELVLGYPGRDRCLPVHCSCCVVESEDVGGGAERADKVASWFRCTATPSNLRKLRANAWYSGANSGGLSMTKSST